MWQKVDFIQQPATTSSVVGPRSSKAFLKKVKLAPKLIITVWWSAASLIHYSLLNPSETITSKKYAQQIYELHRKLHPCSWHCSTERAQFFSAAMPDHTFAQPKLPKLNELGYEVLPHLLHSPDHLPTNYHFFKHLKQLFAGRMLPQLAEERRCFPRVS